MLQCRDKAKAIRRASMIIPHKIKKTGKFTSLEALQVHSDETHPNKGDFYGAVLPMHGASKMVVIEQLRKLTHGDAISNFYFLNSDDLHFRSQKQINELEFLSLLSLKASDDAFDCFCEIKFPHDPSVETPASELIKENLINLLGSADNGSYRPVTPFSGLRTLYVNKLCHAILTDPTLITSPSKASSLMRTSLATVYFTDDNGQNDFGQILQHATTLFDKTTKTLNKFGFLWGNKVDSSLADLRNQAPTPSK